MLYTNYSEKPDTKFNPHDQSWQGLVSDTGHCDVTMAFDGLRERVLQRHEWAMWTMVLSHGTRFAPELAMIYY